MKNMAILKPEKQDERKKKGKKARPRRQGDDPLDPRIRIISPLVPRGKMIREGFRKPQVKPVCQTFQKFGPRQGRRRLL